MDERNPCLLCRHDNPPENRFCGSCGTALADSGQQLVPRRGDGPATTVRTLPAKLGPTGKALAVGLATLAAEAGLLWLRRRAERPELPSLPAANSPEPTVAEYLIGQSVEEVWVWVQEGDLGGRGVARRTVRTFGIAESADR